MQKSILITGVAGLIGSKFADWIIQNNPDYRVVGIDDLSGGYLENINSKVSFYKINLNEDLSKIFSDESPEYVYHFAAYAAEGLSPFIRKYNYQNNLLSTTNLINQSINHNVKKFIFTSSLAVYGHGCGGIFDEDQIPNPIDPYGVAKFACEMDLKIAGDQHGLDWCIIRPHNVYGPNQNIWDRYRNVLGIWMYQAMNNKPMTIFGDGTQTRAFSYIDDILEPLWNAIGDQSSKEIINLGGIEEFSIRDSCEILRKVISKDFMCKVSYLEKRHEVKHSIPTWKKSKEILGFNHNTSLYDGINKMWDWAKSQPTRPIISWDKYEIDKGLYSYWK